jgi:plasmid stabilization system protein ParE
MTARPSSPFLRDTARIALRMERPDAGVRFLRAVDDTVRSLLKHPGLGRQRPDVKPGLHSWRVEGFSNWLIFYRIQGPQLRLLHGARDLPRAVQRH